MRYILRTSSACITHNPVLTVPTICTSTQSNFSASCFRTMMTQWTKRAELFPFSSERHQVTTSENYSLRFTFKIVIVRDTYSQILCRAPELQLRKLTYLRRETAVYYDTLTDKPYFWYERADRDSKLHSSTPEKQANYPPVVRYSSGRTRMATGSLR